MLPSYRKLVALLAPSLLCRRSGGWADKEPVRSAAAETRREDRAASASQYPGGQHAGADPGHRHRSAEPVRDRTREGKLQTFRGQDRAGDQRSFRSEDAPLSVGVVFDCSGSMGNKLEKSRQAVAQFFKTANPEDEFFLVQFNDSADLVSRSRSNLEEIQNRLTFTQSKGRTALLDAHLPGAATR